MPALTKHLHLMINNQEHKYFSMVFSVFIKQLFAFLFLYDILNPWQHSGNSLSESQWKLCNRNKNWAYCEQNLN